MYIFQFIGVKKINIQYKLFLGLRQKRNLFPTYINNVVRAGILFKYLSLTSHVSRDNNQPFVLARGLFQIHNHNVTVILCHF